MNTPTDSTSAPVAGDAGTSAPIAPVNLEVMPEKRFEVAIREVGADGETATSMRAAFGKLFDEADEWVRKASMIRITDASQTREMKVARELRLSIKDVRVRVEHNRKKLKEDLTRRSKAIDGLANIVKALAEGVEADLLAQEQFVERQIEAQKAKLKADRDEKFTAAGGNPALYLFADMPQEDFDRLLKVQLTAAEDKAREIREAEAARVAAEAASAAEKERIRLENERLQREADAARQAAAEAQRLATEAAETACREREALEEQARKERQKAAREAAEAALAARVEREAALAAERAANAAAAEKERQRVEAETQRVAEETRKERERIAEEARVAEAALAAERAANAAAELKRRQDERAAADAAKEAARIEKERLEAEKEARRKAAAAPDRDKLKAFSALVRALEVPTLITPEGLSAAIEVRAKVEGFAGWIDRRAAAAFGEETAPPPARKAPTPKQGEML